MAEKILQTRILNKVDTLENWGSSTLKIKKGEICFATVAASAGTGLEEPVVMVKIGTDEEKTFAELPWSFYAKASDVLTACKSEDGLKAFVNGVIADAGIASSDAMEALAGRVTATEGSIETLNGDESTAGSVAKAIKDAIDALDLDNKLATKVDKVEGSSLVADTEITRLAGMSTGANKVEASETNGNIKIDGVETTVYTHPEKHTSADISDFETAVAGVTVAKAEEATKAAQDGNGKVIADTYAEKATTLAGYGIGDAYTKTETEGKITEAINTFTSAYITSDGGAIDKLQEIADWIDSDKNGSADIIADITDHGTRLGTIEDTLNTHGDIVTHNIAEFYTKEQADAVFTDSTEVDGQIDAKITELALGTMSKETATDYVKKTEAPGYDDILTKTVAQTTYAAIEHDHAIEDVTGLQDALDLKANDADLKAVAKSGLIDDLSIGEGTTLIFDCGTSAV